MKYFSSILITLCTAVFADVSPLLNYSRIIWSLNTSQLQPSGADQKFVWADAEIVGDTVVVSSSKVPEPKAVRFCFNSAPFKYCNYYSKEGLPASPFIT